VFTQAIKHFVMQEQNESSIQECFCRFRSTADSLRFVAYSFASKLWQTSVTEDDLHIFFRDAQLFQLLKVPSYEIRDKRLFQCGSQEGGLVNYDKNVQNMYKNEQ